MTERRSVWLHRQTSYVVLYVTVLTLVASTMVPASAADPQDEGSVQVVVRFENSTDGEDGPARSVAAQRAVELRRAEVVAALEPHILEVEAVAEHRPYLMVEVAADQLDGLEDLPGVAEVLPDPQIRPMLDSATPLVGADAVTGNGRILTGKGRAVAVIDTGVDSKHGFFARTGGGHRVVAEACRAASKDCPNGTDGAGSAAPLKVGSGVDPHGTHVAGIIAGSNRWGAPHRGMAPEADLLAVQAFSTDPSGVATARTWHLIDALDWVYKQRSKHRIVAVNLSLGGSKTYAGTCDGHADFGSLGTDFFEAVARLRSAGIVTVAAAGNAPNGATDGMSFPACLSNVLAVGATTEKDRVADFSHLSHETDLVAPGVSIVSAVPGGGFGTMSGTSMATPMAAGALALLGQAQPTASLDQQIDALTSSDTLISDGRAGGVVTDVPRLDLPSGLDAHDTTAGTATTTPASSLTVKNGDLQAALSWSSVAAPNGGEMAYRLYRSTGSSCSGASSLRYEGTKTSHTDKNLKHGTTYRYCVYAVESSTNRSGRSSVREVKGTDLTAPPAPSLTAKASEQQVALSWSKVSDPTTPITYRLYRSTGSSCSTGSTRIYSGRSNSFTDTGLQTSTTYRYCMTATDAAGNRSALSNIRTATTKDPLAGCTAFSGDWNRSGRSGLGWWCDGKVKLRTSGGKVIAYNYGRAGDVPVVADWNGNGQDTVSVIRDGTWHVNNRLSGGASERTFHYGRVSRGDVPITGDWSRGGRDLPGIIRDREWHLRASQSGGTADWQFVYGRLTAGDLPLWGDWNRDRRDTAGIVRTGTWHLRNVHSGGPADLSFVYGRVLSGDVPVVGDWTGDGIDTPGIVRDGQWHLRHRNEGGVADRVITFPRP